MTLPEDDCRSADRRRLDEQLASAPMLPHPQISLDAASAPLEAHLSRLRRPIALAGVVENGVIRPLDPAIKLAEHTRVIIVTSGGNP